MADRGAHRDTILSFEDACRGRWLHLMGDSSLRGVWLALYQQLVSQSSFTVNTGVMDMRSWAPISVAAPSVAARPGLQRFAAFSWIDVILEEHAEGWEVLAARYSADPISYPHGAPSADWSGLITPLWCNESHTFLRSHIRLSWQMVTHTRVLVGTVASNFKTWRALACHTPRHRKPRGETGGPDALLLASAAWDAAAAVPPRTSYENLRKVLLLLRQEANASGRLLGFAAALESTGRPWSDLGWQRSFVDQANQGDGLGPRVAFIERHGPSRILSMLAPDCLRNLTRSDRFHPPHAINVPLLPLLMELWLGGEHGCNYSETAIRSTMQTLLSSGGDQQCCSRRPGVAELPDGGHDAATSYWAMQCRLKTPPAVQCDPLRLRGQNYSRSSFTNTQYATDDQRNG